MLPQYHLPELQGRQDVLFFIFITFLMKVMKNNPPGGGKVI
jgi:hypothetical protein